MGRRARVNARKRNRRIVIICVIVAISVAAVAFALLISSTFSCNYCSYLGQDIPSSLYQQVTGVSSATLSAVGSPSSVVAPKAVTGTALTLDGKPEILYIGAEYCPYCAVERWSLIMALSKFGNFTGIQYMLSSSTDVNANTPTFTFYAATYSSQYVSFVPVEEYNRTNPGVVWHQLTSQEQSIYSQYGSGGIPFVDFANQYVINGVQSTLDISDKNWTYVASQLDTPSSPIAQDIDGATNSIISAVCKIDGGEPSSVCTQSYANITLAYTSGGSANPTPLVASLLPNYPGRAVTRWTI